MRPGSNMRVANPVSSGGGGLRAGEPGFTLIEIMVVVGIMGIILTMSVPIVWKVFHKAPLNKAVADVVEVCSNARRQAIMQGHQVDVVFHPLEGRFEVAGGAAGTANTPPPGSGTAAANPPVAASAASTMSGTGLAASFDRSVTIDMLDINKNPDHDFKLDEFARVRFFPNGTSDELTLILRSDRGEQLGVVLEVTTGLPSVLNEKDLQHLLDGTL